MANDDLGRLLRQFKSHPPATNFAIEQLVKGTGRTLPASYTGFLRHSNGGEGFIGENSFLQLWRAEDIADLNARHAVEQYTPDLLLFGSDGAGSAYAFDFRQSPPRILCLPFIGFELRHSETLGETFEEFLLTLYQRNGSDI